MSETTERKFFEDEDLLTIKDRINYSYILSVKLLTLDKILTRDTEESSSELLDAIESIMSSIPSRYKDEEYEARV